MLILRFVKILIVCLVVFFSGVIAIALTSTPRNVSSEPEAGVVIPTTSAKASIVDLKRIGTQGRTKMYVLNNPEDTASPSKIGIQLRGICDEAGFPVCIVMVWKNAADAATVLPMSDQQANAQYLSYSRNRNTNHEELLVGDGTGGMKSVPISEAAP